jgi:hypothetical protein
VTLAVYVAASSREMPRARWAMDALRAAGVRITCDWVAAIEAAGAANEGLTDEQRRRYASEDLYGLRLADVVWLLAPETPSAGAWVELGYAMAWRHLRIVVSGPSRVRCVFAALADLETDRDEDALAEIVAMAGER